MREHMFTQAPGRELAHAFPALPRLVKNWWKRRSLRKLEDLDDYMLSDIGLTRADLIFAQKLPLDIDPVAEVVRERRLQPRSRGRRHS